MKKFLATIPLTLLCFSFGFSQTKNEKPDFSGTWKFDKAESGSYFMGKEINDFSGKLIFKCDVDTVIEHKEPEIKIKQTSVCDNGKTKAETITTYFSDGRGEINQSENNTSVESATKWNGNKIIIVSYLINSKKKKSPDITKEITISKNGSKMTQKIYSSSNSQFARDSYTKMVFNLSK